MGKLNQGILGPVKKKVGNVFGTGWKGTNVIKANFTPKNPKSQSQQLNRDFIKQLTTACKLIHASVVVPYWNPFHPDIGGWAAILRYNIRNMARPFVWDDFVIADGYLQGANIVSCDYETALGRIFIQWDNSITGNGSDDDWTGLVCFNADLETAYFDSGGTRDEGQQYLQIGQGHNVNDLKVYLFFSNNETPFKTVSHSSFIQPVAV